MAELNLEENVLKLTLGDMVQQFTEADLQREMPVFMQDIDAGTKDIIDAYQAYLAAGNFTEAETYRAGHPELDTRIWDAKKANSFMAYAAFAYLYAKNQKQQLVISDTQPEGYGENDTDFQVEGDIWLKVSEEKDGVTMTTPYQRQADGTYKEFSVTKTLEAKNVTYDSSVSGIDAATVQEGMDEIINNAYVSENELKNKIDNVENTVTKLYDKIMNMRVLTGESSGIVVYTRENPDIAAEATDGWTGTGSAHASGEGASNNMIMVTNNRLRMDDINFIKIVAKGELQTRGATANTSSWPGSVKAILGVSSNGTDFIVKQEISKGHTEFSMILDVSEVTGYCFILINLIAYGNYWRNKSDSKTRGNNSATITLLEVSVS